MQFEIALVLICGLSVVLLLSFSSPKRPDRIMSSAASSSAALREFREAELAPFTGVGGGPIYVAVDGIVFDMASNATGPSFYGPGGGYALFAGVDATIGLATMNLKPAEWSATVLSSLSSEQRKTLDDWTAKFIQKYAVVGSLVDGANPTTLEQLRARVPLGAR